jgi:hypothetical protein
MNQPVGFGKLPSPDKKSPSEGAKKRSVAAKEYDQMKASGMPEYEISIRVVGKKQWLPVGAIAVKRSTQIHQAIYANESALLEGAFHRMPVLKKNRANLEFEYGYRLKEFKDEPIELAVRPANQPTQALKNAIGNVGTVISNIFQKPAK